MVSGHCGRAIPAIPLQANHQQRLLSSATATLRCITKSLCSAIAKDSMYGWSISPVPAGYSEVKWGWPSCAVSLVTVPRPSSAMALRSMLHRPVSQPVRQTMIVSPPRQFSLGIDISTRKGTSRGSPALGIVWRALHARRRTRAGNSHSDGRRRSTSRATNAMLSTALEGQA